ncbi:DUF3231 family protein [Virgibacillus dakarensis]|uniref:Membrane protein n=1 Tax=Lentibacillus populi TaxID=1827502 RepID=A0A9W5TVA8_9BACI|nr:MULTISPECIES: DUF3231 family protein [Bacillaceae]MBT2214962.1 DUF3231 family protein [Virgibacillus dakarensis]MTW84836.1 DUF3231 family protein [Virgibacillus dakarensis]GGB31438.1 membrane protein [Lentibacillus populi]
MSKLNGNPQEEPLHSGEVFHLWSYLYGSKAVLVTMQVLINHTGDHDLKVFLEDLVESGFTQEEQQVEAIIKETGIRLPPAPPDRPNVEVQDIPAGARFNDPEIAGLVQKELTTGKILCSYIMGISFREDIRTMFGEFHTQKEEYEVKLMGITKEKGWIVSPPINLK